MLNHIKIITLGILSISLLLSCQPKNDKTGTISSHPIDSLENVHNEQNLSSTETKKAIFQKTIPSKGLVFIVNAVNEDISHLNVKIKGLSTKEYDVDFEIKGHVQDAFVLDLNNDTFEELYLIIDPINDPNNQHLKAIASYRNLSAGEIYVRKIDEFKTVIDAKFYIKNRELFSINTLERKQVKYGYILQEGETGYILSPKKLSFTSGK